MRYKIHWLESTLTSNYKNKRDFINTYKKLHVKEVTHHIHNIDMIGGLE